jgi:hypothetical protein
LQRPRIAQRQVQGGSGFGQRDIIEKAARQKVTFSRWKMLNDAANLRWRLG